MACDTDGGSTRALGGVGCITMCSNVAIFCGAPSSRISKSPAFKSCRGTPSFVANASTRTRFVPPRNRGGCGEGRDGWLACGDCANPASKAIPAIRANSNRTHLAARRYWLVQSDLRVLPDQDPPDPAPLFCLCFDSSPAELVLRSHVLRRPAWLVRTFSTNGRLRAGGHDPLPTVECATRPAHPRTSDVEWHDKHPRVL